MVISDGVQRRGSPHVGSPAEGACGNVPRKDSTRQRRPSLGDSRQAGRERGREQELPPTRHPAAAASLLKL